MSNIQDTVNESKVILATFTKHGAFSPYRMEILDHKSEFLGITIESFPGRMVPEVYTRQEELDSVGGDMDEFRSIHGDKIADDETALFAVRSGYVDSQFDWYGSEAEANTAVLDECETFWSDTGNTSVVFEEMTFAQVMATKYPSPAPSDDEDEEEDA